ncbi:MAG TPA: hypothetical protein DCW68_06835 [Rhodospirillaceae bacterium]|nr:MAG: hypothetical protein A2018_01345 [Alphaproteobacteria bacterium GWF2_58_20]HAU29803.1 hypothetical protein [Rhodospirillaceae bacterium]
MPAKVTYNRTLGDEIERGFTKAKLRAGKKLKTAVLRDQKRRIKQQYPGAGKRRLDSVRAFITPHGSHVVFSDYSPGASIHEEGGTIGPKKSKFLMVRFKDAKTLDSTGKTFILNRNGKKILMRKISRAVAKPIAVLMRRVTIKAKLGFEDTVVRNFPAYVDDLENEIIKGI